MMSERACSDDLMVMAADWLSNGSAAVGAESNRLRVRGYDAGGP